MSDTGLHTVRPLFTVSSALALGKKLQSTNTLMAIALDTPTSTVIRDGGTPPAADAVCTNVNFDVTSE